MKNRIALPQSFQARQGKVLLILFFAVLALLAGVTVFAYLGNLKLVSLIDTERVFYEKNIDEQGTSLNRVVFAVSDLLIGAESGRDGANFTKLITLAQSAMNHAGIPEIIEPSFLRLILGDDPLYLADRVSTSNDLYRDQIKNLVALIGRASNQGTGKEGMETLDEILRSSEVFMKELKERSQLLTQLAGAYHAATRDNLTRFRTQFRLNMLSISLVIALLITVSITYFQSRLKIERETNARLLASIGEKDVLIKEVYHRVKNNLAIVASLISLQSTEAGPENIEDSFEKLSQRIHAISLIHERLSHSKDFSNVDFKDYIKDLGDTLVFSLAGIRTAVDFEISAPDVKFHADILVPLGLIVTELMTNSLKYAFEGRERGRISISLVEVENGFVLEVRDDGTPPADERTILEGASLGSMLVASLTRQIGGTLKLDLSGGTGVIIRFPGNSKAT